MSDERLDLPQGTLDLLILKTLSLEPMHGWAISERLRQVSRAMLQIPQGSIYPALHRLERRGVDHGGVGTVGQQPEGEVLRAHEAGSQTAGGGVRPVGAVDDGCRIRAGHEVTGAVMWREVWHDVRYRVRAFLRRDAAERDLDAEIEDHLAREVESLERSGVSPSDARRQARLAFGGLDGTRERTRDAWGTTLVDSVVQDLGYACRGIAARPAFSLGVTLTLALGIGANAAMLGIVDRLLFRPPPYLKDVDLVHRVYLSRRSRGTETFQRWTSIGRLLDITRSTKSFSSIAAVATQRRATGEAPPRGTSRSRAPAPHISTCSTCTRSLDGCSTNRTIGFRRDHPSPSSATGIGRRRLAPGPT